MTTATEEDLKKLREDFAELRNDVAALARTLTKSACSDRSPLEEAKDYFGDMRADIESTVARGKEQIEQRPLASAATSFAIGLFLGMVFSKR